MKIKKWAQREGFTLIELLIVVAIIAILAAIAVPNFLEAQVRSKVSRARADLRNLALAQESYTVDHNRYTSIDAPRHRSYIDYNKPDLNYPNTMSGGTPLIGRLVVLSTPIAYLTSIPKDIFNLGTDPWSLNSKNWNTYTYASQEGYDLTSLDAYAKGIGYPGHPKWVLFSYGPQITQLASMDGNKLYSNVRFDIPYDPTNGTTSKGTLVRLGP